LFAGGFFIWVGSVVQFIPVMAVIAVALAMAIARVYVA
jgi:hypothetical protein